MPTEIRRTVEGEQRIGYASALETIRQYGIDFTAAYLKRKQEYADEFEPPLLAAYWMGYATAVEDVRKRVEGSSCHE